MTIAEQNLSELIANSVKIGLYDENGIEMTALGYASAVSGFIQGDDCKCVQNDTAASFTSSEQMRIAYVKALIGTVEYASYKLVPVQVISPQCVYKIGIGEFKICYDCHE